MKKSSARSQKRKTAPQDAVLKELQKMPNVGPAVAGCLWRLGIRKARDCRGKNPLAMYKRLCLIDGERHDPCVLDTMMAVVDYAEHGIAKPWWKFTSKRKSMSR